MPVAASLRLAAKTKTPQLPLDSSFAIGFRTGFGVVCSRAESGVRDPVPTLMTAATRESPFACTAQERDLQSPCFSSNSLPSQMYQLNQSQQDADITDLFGAQGAAIFTSTQDSPVPGSSVIVVDRTQRAREFAALNEQTLARNAAPPSRKRPGSSKEAAAKDISSPIDLDLESSSADETPSTCDEENEDVMRQPTSKRRFSTANPTQSFKIQNRKPHPERRKRRSVSSSSPVSARGTTKISSSTYMRKCWSCSADSTPCWRPAPWVEGESHLCNGCGLRYKKSGVRCTECRYIPSKGERAAMLIACVKCSGSAIKD
ncbi:Transcriptional regulatory protein ASH1 [Neolecta irregularis DAH-3]|uniref:Transcriptional regulatory protein ASH1 n=1 Tax=Neolecta irregularis (strain DAH-3) TaxID=1198029 RepID=A0A1U7LRE3_NEOID|nr:Transcriptional regulatory protein ASH1 [Neolecta irregularis DAH-3]|eukprot:OLL25227.1 Transcriptional regulatory protein ASH1 [Neolecta irregularis DAH-3]